MKSELRDIMERLILTKKIINDIEYYDGISNGFSIITGYRPDVKSHPNQKEQGLGYVQGYNLDTHEFFSRKVYQNTKGYHMKCTKSYTYSTSKAPTSQYFEDFTVCARFIPSQSYLFEEERQC